MTAAPAEATQEPAAAPAPEPQATPDPAPAEQTKTYDEAYVKQLRDEAAANRTKARDAETAAQAKIAAALEALGIKADTEDPAEAAKQAAAERDQATQAAKEAALHLAVYKAAGKSGADADALLDSNSFRSTLAEVDPGDAAAVQTAIDNAVKTNPRFKLVQAARASGSDFSGGSSEGAISQAQFDAMNVAERTSLYTTNPALYRQLSGR